MLLRFTAASNRNVSANNMEANASQVLGEGIPWGSSDATETVWLNGCNAKITKSFNSALCDLYERVLADGRDCYVWMDAICINPQDNKEKLHQVQQM